MKKRLIFALLIIFLLLIAVVGLVKKSSNIHNQTILYTFENKNGKENSMVMLVDSLLPDFDAFTLHFLGIHESKTISFEIIENKQDYQNLFSDYKEYQKFYIFLSKENTEAIQYFDKVKGIYENCNLYEFSGYGKESDPTAIIVDQQIGLSIYSIDLNSLEISASSTNFFLMNDYKDFIDFRIKNPHYHAFYFILSKGNKEANDYFKVAQNPSIDYDLYEFEGLNQNSSCSAVLVNASPGISIGDLNIESLGISANCSKVLIYDENSLEDLYDFYLQNYAKIYILAGKSDYKFSQKVKGFFL